MIKLVAGWKGFKWALHVNIYTLSITEWTKGQFSFCAINLHPKRVMFSLWDYAYTVTLSLAIQGNGFFGEWFQHSKSGLVCILNHCTLLGSRNCFFSLFLVLILPCEHLNCIWGLWSLLREVLGFLRAGSQQRDLPTAPRAGEGGVGMTAYGWGKVSTQWSWGWGPSVNSPFEQLYFALPKDSKHKLPGGI